VKQYVNLKKVLLSLSNAIEYHVTQSYLPNLFLTFLEAVWIFCEDIDYPIYCCSQIFFDCSTAFGEAFSFITSYTSSRATKSSDKKKVFQIRAWKKKHQVIY